LPILSASLSFEAIQVLRWNFCHCEPPRAAKQSQLDSRDCFGRCAPSQWHESCDTNVRLHLTWRAVSCQLERRMRMVEKGQEGSEFACLWEDDQARGVEDFALSRDGLLVISVESDPYPTISASLTTYRYWWDGRWKRNRRRRRIKWRCTPMSYLWRFAFDVWRVL